MVHCPADGGRRRGGRRARGPPSGPGSTLFGDTEVRFPVAPSVVECYADAK